MNVVAWFHTQRYALLFVVTILALAGLMSIFSLPVSLFPNVSFPRVRVDINAGSRPASQMVVAVTTPVAEAIRGVRGIRNVHSLTSRGSAQVIVDFDWGANMARSLLNVNAAMSRVLPELPPGTTFHAIRMEPTNDEPVIAFSLRSSTLTQTQLYDIAEYQLRPLISGVQGVALADVQGRGIAELHVNVNPSKLRAQHLTLADVTHAVSAAANIKALGRLADHYKLFLLLANNQPDSVKALSDVVLRAGPGGVVRVGDIATVTRGMKPQWVRTGANGKSAILIQVFQQPSASSLKMVDAVKAKLAAYAPQMPKGVKLATWYNQTILVRQSAASVRDAIIIGIILAALVLFAFLRNTRVILIAALVVPATLAITTLLLKVFGMSFNMMTLGGMAAAVGLLIDDVVVMTEHIMRRLRDDPSPGAPTGAGARIIAAAHEFAHPQTGSSLATIVIFLPLAGLSGITGAFFKALAITMASALVISYLLTFMVVPLLSEWLLDEKHVKEHPPTRLWRGLMTFYEKLLRRTLKRPVLLLVGIVPLIVLGFFAFKSVGSGFLPPMDQGGFVLDYLSPPGTSLAETDRLLEKVNKILAANPYVSNWSRRTGLQLGGGLTEANTGDFFVRLKSSGRPSTSTVMEHIREEVVAQVPGLDVDVAQLLDDMIGDLTAVPQPIQVKLFSNDVPVLNATAKKVAAQIRKIRGVVSVRNGIKPAGNALEVHVDPVKAGLLGLNPQSVVDQVATAAGGTIAARLPEGPKMVAVRVWVPPPDRARIEQLEALEISDGHGNVYPLSRVATITEQTGQPEIDRENLQRMVAVTGRITGRALGSVMADVKQVLAQPGELPPGMHFTLGGLYHQQQVAMRGLTIVLVTAIVLVFTLLLFLYKDFRTAIVILIQPLLTICAVFIGLWITGTQRDISSMMGMTMIVGIVTELAIFYFSELRESESHTSRDGPLPLLEALVSAGRHRTRAILMSMLAMVLTLLPLAIAIGRGAQMQQPLAIAIISGMLAAPPLVLVVMPVLYHLLRPNRSTGPAA
ncbi:MAG TPA: efflux RND transporter permease subunit [Rhodanobacteraceae bacterium]